MVRLLDLHILMMYRNIPAILDGRNIPAILDDGHGWHENFSLLVRIVQPAARVGPCIVHSWRVSMMRSSLIYLEVSPT